MIDKADVKIKNVKDKHTLILCKMNGQKMGYIHYNTVTKLYRGVKVISELEFTIDKYYGVNNEFNPLYDELLNERLIELDDEEVLVIKEVKKTNNSQKQIKAYGKEKKLCKISVELEDITLTLLNPYEDIKGCYSLDELLYEATGWHVGYVSDEVLYRKEETILDILTEATTTLTTEEKLRYQESVSSNWYDFINDDISEQFECYPVFDSYNKLVHLYSDGEMGERLQLMLTYDNYLKSHEVVSNTDDIITRLTLKGNEDLTIIAENPSGDDYLEDYTYFMERGEMTEELTNALEKYNEIVKVRTEQWYQLKSEKESKSDTLQEKKISLIFIYRQITAKQRILEMIDKEEQAEYYAQIAEDIVGLTDEQIILEREIDTLTEEVALLNESINHVNLLCKKSYATDENGILIFNETLLNELKEFIFQDSYDNDSITDGLTLYKVGQRELQKRMYPTITWSIDVANFSKRLIDNGFRQQWKGELALGDMILLRDDEGIVTPVYLIGYTQSFKKGSESIQLELSNIKENNEFSLNIGQRLTMAKTAYKIVKSNQSAINKLNKNRVGLKYDKINKEIL